VTDFDLKRELGKLFQAESHRLKKSFSNELVRHNGFRIVKSKTECKLYDGILTLKYSLGDQGVRLLNIL